MENYNSTGGSISIEEYTKRQNLIKVYPTLDDDDDEKKDIDCIILRRLNNYRETKWLYQTSSHWVISASADDLENLVKDEKEVLLRYHKLRNLELIKHIKEKYSNVENICKLEVVVLGILSLKGSIFARNKLFESANRFKAYEKKVDKILKRYFKINLEEM